VAAVNRKIGALGGGARSRRTIGILDIYGFESFDTNSFEQLCINLANEKLQQAFNAHVFKGEQEEYAAEGIAWSRIDFKDNQDALDLLEGLAGGRGQQPGVGIFPLVDEACRLPRATYKDLAHALRSKLAGRPRFGAPRRQQHCFVVDHYAGEVCYSAEDLIEKNRDFVVAEHQVLMAGSNAQLLRELFAAPSASPDGAGDGAAAQRRSAFMLASIGARFRRQLQDLISALSATQPHFIRCVKPNPAGRPGALDPDYVLEQLRAGGVLEAVRIAVAGYPTRKPFLPFAQRYSVLLGLRRLVELGLPLTPAGLVDWGIASRDKVVDITTRVLYGAGLEGWQLGNTRAFLRAGQLAQLEGLRGRALSASATKVQAAFRAMEARRALAMARSGAASIQAAWRGHVARGRSRELRGERAATCIQALWRMHAQRAIFQKRRRWVWCAFDTLFFVLVSA
jgi:myosin V